ncbi:hypothetical protein [Halochromatium roseum]|uniref:hypothetical protein n=1 Tax=Halochromatium roseum TaxID=391920 RepID=UPI001914D233|nr:hypothetical protein [Halochromatium roseum]
MSQEQPSNKITIKVDTQIVMLKQGLYLFRCASDYPEGQQVPTTLQAAPVATGQVDFFPGVGVSRNTLRALGDCVVVRVSRGDGAVMLAKYLVPGHSAANDVQIQIDQVDATGRFVRDSETKRDPSAGGMSSSPSSQLETIDLQGHVERQGDVSAVNGWLGNPQKSARLEGFSVHWYNRPEGVDLAYQCHVEGLGDSPLIKSGGFVGTRQRGAGITQILFSLVGQRAGDYEIQGQVCFTRGGSQQIVAGERFSGPTGREHLSALRLSIARRQRGEATVPRSPSPWDDPSVTQIFRSGY